MKKTSTTLLLFCIAITIILSSCGSSHSIMKRRYTKGYYVSHGKNRHTKAKEQTSVNAKVQQPVLVAPKTEDTPPAVQPSPLTAQSPVTAPSNNFSSEKTGAASKKSPRSSAAALNQTAPLELLAKKQFKLLDNKSLQKAPHSEGLSLFWIVIVVLLVLFFLGLAGDVLGALIYILLVVALVLLILWLLRIL